MIPEERALDIDSLYDFQVAEALLRIRGVAIAVVQ